MRLRLTQLNFKWNCQLELSLAKYMRNTNLDLLFFIGQHTDFAIYFYVYIRVYIVPIARLEKIIWTGFKEQSRTCDSWSYMTVFDIVSGRKEFISELSPTTLPGRLAGNFVTRFGKTSIHEIHTILLARRTVYAEVRPLFANCKTGYNQKLNILLPGSHWELVQNIHREECRNIWGVGLTIRY